MPRLTTPIPAHATATQFSVQQISLHDDVQSVGITVALISDDDSVLRTVHRVFSYADLGVVPQMTIVGLRNAALVALRASQDIN